MAEMNTTQLLTKLKTWVLGKIGNITDLIPSQATLSNQLADKAFVNSSIATSTATFRGTYNLVTDLSLTTSATEQQIAAALDTKMSALSITPDNNDYVFVQVPTADATPTEIARIDRYKYNGTAWTFEYSINNSGFTAAQWASINSGITSGLVGKLSALPTAAEIETLLGAKEDKSNKVTTITDASTDTQYSSAKAVYTFVVAMIATAIASLKEWAEGLFAKMDGFYESMGVGGAKNLIAPNITTGGFFARPTGGENAELANGLAQLMEVKGNSVKYNQLAASLTAGTYNGITFTKNADGTFTLNTDANGATSTSVFTLNNIDVIANHKYMMNGVSGGSASTYKFDVVNALTAYDPKITYTSVNFTNKGVRLVVYKDTVLTNLVVAPQLIDLTALGIDNLTTVAQVEAWLAANYGAMEYYPYSEGAVVNVNMTGIESFKKNLLNPTTGKAYIIGAYSEVYGNYYGICGTYGTLTFKDAYGNESTITPDSDGKFELNVAGELTVANAGADCAVFLWWDGTETEYSEYGSNIAKLDIAHIYGKKNGTGELVRVWPTGMPAIGDLQDYLKIEDGAVVAKRMIGEINMGGTTTSWTLQSDGRGFLSSSINSYIVKDSFSIVIRCGRYVEKTYNSDGSQIARGDKTITSNQLGSVFVKDSSYTDAATFKTAMNGVMLYFRLKTPETYTDLVYMGSELFADGTPVTLPVNYEADNWGIERVLPLNTSEGILTAAPTLSCKYSIDAVEQLDTHTQEIADLYEKNALLDAKKPNADGYYKYMRVGLSDNLADEKAFKEIGMLHMTASSVEVSGNPRAITYPSKDIANGMSQVLTLEGNGVAFNQFYPAGSDGLFATDSDCPTTLLVRYSNSAGTTEMGYLDCAEVLQVSDLTVSDCALLSDILTKDAHRSCATVWLDEAGNKLAVSVTEGAASWTLEATGEATTPTKVCRRAIRVKASEVNCGVSGENWWFTATKGSLRQIKDMSVKDGIEDGSSHNEFWLAKPFDTCSVMDWIHWCEAKEGAQGIETQNAGSLAGAKLYQIKAVISVNLLDPTTGLAELPWYVNEGDAVDGQFTLVKPSGAEVTLSLLNKATGLVSTPTVDADGHFVIGSNSVLTVTAASLDGIGVLATYDGSIDEEELDEYAAQTLVIDVTKIFAPSQGEGGADVQVAPEGLRRAGSAADVISLVNAEATVKIKTITLQSTDFVSEGTESRTGALFVRTANLITDAKYSNLAQPRNAISTIFSPLRNVDTTWINVGHFGFHTNGYVLSTLLHANRKSSIAAYCPIKAFYELDTPKHYTSLVYRDNGVDIPLNQLIRSLQVCNWATTKAVCAAPTENTVDGHTSVLPQSCSPVITSEYSSNIPEQVDSHSQQIADLEARVVVLEAGLNS